MESHQIIGLDNTYSINGLLPVSQEMTDVSPEALSESAFLFENLCL